MRLVILAAVGAVAVAVSLTSASAASNPVDAYSFAGGKEVLATAPVSTGRSVAIDGTTSTAAADFTHAFATWGSAE